MLDPPEMTPHVAPAIRPHWRSGQTLNLGLIIAVAAVLRLWALGGPSLWYDEVVTMQVARTAGPIALVERLDQIDGTRAPLHPLVLQAWLRIFGPSDLAGRSLSALCGLGTVAVIYLLGRQAFDEMTGRWAAWLAAVCPPLVYYSQEARMYAWLVLLSALSWLVLLSFRKTATLPQRLGYWLLLTALVYSHPLGLFMVAAHGLAFLIVGRYLKLTTRRWLALQAAVIVAIIPWLPRYLDHGTDYPMPRQPIRFLLAVPIEFVGGNSVVLVICLAIIAWGMLAHDRPGRWPRPALSFPTENLVFVCWASVPPITMYVYSLISTPLFGPPRYHLFIAPAYLILLAHGLSRLPTALRWPLSAGGAVLSLLLFSHYQQAMKADWRSLAAWLLTQEKTAGTGDSPRARPTVVVHPSDPRFPREQVEAARYYLSPRTRVIGAGEPAPGISDVDPAAPVFEVDCLSRPGDPEKLDPTKRYFFGLRVKAR